MPWNDKNIKVNNRNRLPYNKFKQIYGGMGLQEWQYTKLYNKFTDKQLDEISLFSATKGEYGQDALQFWDHPTSREGKVVNDVFIPYELDGHPIMGANDNPFWQTKITSVTVPEDHPYSDIQ